MDNARGDWNELLSAASTNNVFLTWEWQRSWWEFYGRRRTLRVLRAFDDDGRVCGIAPLCVGSTYVGPLRFRTLEFLGSRHVASEYLDFIVRRDVHREVVTAFFRELDRQHDWDLFLGYHTPAESPTLTLFHDGGLGLPGIVTGQATSLYVPCVADWDTYVSKLGKLTRRNLRYYRKGVENDLHGEVCDLRNSIPQSLPQLIELHQKRMRQLGFPGSFSSSRFVQFHEHVAKLFSERGWGRLYALRVGDALIAANYGFAYNGTFSDYSMGFDPDYKDYSVGFVLWTYMLERCMQEGLEVDFLDPGRFKELWKPRQRLNLSYAIGASARALAAYGRATATRSFVMNTAKRLLPNRVATRVGVWKDSVQSRLS